MIKHWLSILLLCLIGVPVAVYLVGGLIVGPYEGEGGILGMVGTIYADALTGHLSAWVLLSSPLLLVAIWMLVARLNKLT